LIWWKWKTQLDWVIKPVPHDLVLRIRFWGIKSPEQEFKYLYWTIRKILSWNLFTCKGTWMIDWVGWVCVYVCVCALVWSVNTFAFLHKTWLISMGLISRQDMTHFWMGLISRQDLTHFYGTHFYVTHFYVTQYYARYGSFQREILLIHMWARNFLIKNPHTTYSCVRHDSFLCHTFLYVKSLILTRDMAHLYVTHLLFLRETELILTHRLFLRATQLIL